METILHFLKEKTVFLDIEAGIREELLQAACQRLGDLSILDADTQKQFCEALLEREKLGTTALGGGVALPHAYVTGLPEVLVSVIRLKEGIDYGSQDGKPAQLFFVLGGSEKKAFLHLQIIAKLARLFRDDTLIGELLSVTSPADFIRAIENAEVKHCS